MDYKRGEEAKILVVLWSKTRNKHYLHIGSSTYGIRSIRLNQRRFTWLLRGWDEGNKVLLFS